MTPLEHYALNAVLVNRVWHASAENLLAVIPDEAVDLIVTSPPYDNLRTYQGYTWDFERIARESYRVLKRGGVLVWVVGDATVNGSETLTSFRQALYFRDVVGFRMHDTMIWEKDSATYIRNTRRYAPIFEYMFIFTKGEVATFNPLYQRNKLAGVEAIASRRQRNGKNVQYRDGKTPVKQENMMSNIWKISTGYMRLTADRAAYTHPAMFPEELARRHILTWSNPGDLVLDYFVGSGTTAKMARNTKRRYIVGDLSADYCAIARDRLRMPFERRHVKASDDVRDLPLFSCLP